MYECPTCDKRLKRSTSRHKCFHGVWCGIWGREQLSYRSRTCADCNREIDYAAQMQRWIEQYKADMKNDIAVIRGCAVGDSLGMPFETRKWDDPAILQWNGEFLGSEYHKLKPGQYTDDTQMSMALARSFKPGPYPYDAQRAADAYLAWFKSGDVRGIGGTIKRAMRNLEAGASCETSGMKPTPGYPTGNGAVMRCAPLGAAFWRDETPRELTLAVAKDARITHDADDAVITAVTVASLVQAYAGNRLTGQANGRSALWERVLSEAEPRVIYEKIPRWEDACREIAMQVQVANQCKVRRALDTAVREQVIFWGYDTIGLAASAILISIVAESYVHGVELAIKAGGDTDTLAAVVGALLGAYFGTGPRGIPGDWLDLVEGGKELEALDTFLVQVGASHEL